MNKFFVIICITIMIFGFSCKKGDDRGSGADNRITISGAWALYPMVVKWASEYQKQHPSIIIDISAGGAGKGMTDALTGTVDLGMVSRDVYKAEIDKGAWWISVVKDAVIPVINAENPLKETLLKRGLSRKEFTRIWITDAIRDWNTFIKSDTTYRIHIYTRSDACGAAETWAKYVGGSQEDLKGVGVYGDPGLADAVRNDLLGIGYNNVNFAYDASTEKPVRGILILPIDINANGMIDPQENFYADRDSLIAAIADGRYPSPPARDLHLVSHGVPRKKEVARFLVWILGEGQKYISEAGYIALPAERLIKQTASLAGAAQ
ncbi:MAG: substrate-binding domain-containing protein [Spirochaetes bacterium]|nr:substrate-binding domain-containing protein [Spirochaetota bacterium]